MKERPAPWRAAILAGRRPYAWLAALAALAYARCLSYGIILLDDNIYVVDKNPFLRDWANLAEVFRSGSFLGAAQEFYYRPLLVASFMLDAHLGAQDPAVYHLSNILFHAAAVALVFRLLRRVVGTDRAFALSAVFACHPALANAVAWINGRTDVLLAVFALASFGCWQDYLAGEKRRFLAGHFVFLIPALLTKELAVVVPAACLAYAALVARRPPPARDRAVLALGWLAALGAWWLARHNFVHPEAGFPPWDMAVSVLSNLPALLHYWGKAFLPVMLSPYPLLSAESITLGITAALAAAWFLRRPPSRTAVWGLCWFVLFAVPGLAYLGSSGTSVLFDYRVYLPLVGALVVAAELEPLRSFSLNEPELAGATAVAVALLLALNWSAGKPYQDDLSAWTRAVEESPGSAFAQMQLGTACIRRGDLACAEARYLRAIELDPRQPMAHNNLGVVCMRTGRLPQAEALYLAELSLNPNYKEARENLALLRGAR